MRDPLEGGASEFLPILLKTTGSGRATRRVSLRYDVDGPLQDRDFEQVQVLKDPDRGILVFLAIHDTRLGPAFGGVRRRVYETPEEALDDALRLAEAMTWKCALAGVSGGGGKAVIADRPGMDRERAYRLLARHVQQMGGRFHTGPDVGTGSGDLEVMAEETGFVALPGPEGPGDLSASTALGVLSGIEAVAERLGGSSLRGVEICVQGLGEVGWRLASLLSRAGASLRVSDLRPDPVRRAVQQLGAVAVEPGQVVTTPCDILAPCALGGVLDDQTIPALRARAVAGAANNVLADPDHGEELHRRGILYAPDFAINAGGLIHGALFFLDGAVPPPERIREIGPRIGRILDDAKSRDVPPDRIALRIARDRVAAARTGPYFPRR